MPFSTVGAFGLRVCTRVLCVALWATVLAGEMASSADPADCIAFASLLCVAKSLAFGALGIPWDGVPFFHLHALSSNVKAACDGPFGLRFRFEGNDHGSGVF